MANNYGHTHLSWPHAGMLA